MCSLYDQRQLKKSYRRGLWAQRCDKTLKILADNVNSKREQCRSMMWTLSDCLTFVCALHVFRLGRRHCFLLSISLSCLFGVVVCLSNSAVTFLLLRLSQGSMLAGVFLSSYIISEYPVQTLDVMLIQWWSLLQPCSVISQWPTLCFKFLHQDLMPEHNEFF